MDFLYFLVTDSKIWKDDTLGFHKNFFADGGGFTLGWVGALVLGLIFCLVFYFGCCNSKKSSKSANIGVWAIFMIIAAAASYFYGDYVVIGQPRVKEGKAQTESIFRKYSFYKANKDYVIIKTDKRINPSATPESNKRYREAEKTIAGNLDKGKDVRFDFDITTAVLGAVFFFIFSILFKRFTINGRSVPFLKP